MLGQHDGIPGQNRFFGRLAPKDTLVMRADAITAEQKHDEWAALLPLPSLALQNALVILGKVKGSEVVEFQPFEFLYRYTRLLFKGVRADEEQKEIVDCFDHVGWWTWWWLCGRRRRRRGGGTGRFNLVQDTHLFCAGRSKRLDFLGVHRKAGHVHGTGTRAGQGIHAKVATCSPAAHPVLVNDARKALVKRLAQLNVQIGVASVTPPWHDNGFAGVALLAGQVRSPEAHSVIKL